MFEGLAEMMHFFFYCHTKKALVSADISAQLEHSVLKRNCGKRPDGVTILFLGELGKCLVWDFSVDTFKLRVTYTYLSGAAAEAAVQRKHEKYSRIKSCGMDLVVVVI